MKSYHNNFADIEYVINKYFPNVTFNNEKVFFKLEYLDDPILKMQGYRKETYRTYFLSALECDELIVRISIGYNDKIQVKKILIKVKQPNVFSVLFGLIKLTK